MSETDEENHGSKSKEATFMELDLDLDSSWPLIDQIPFFYNPISPFPTLSDQPCSPLWAFSDDEKLAGNVFSTFSGGGGLRIPDYPRFLSLNADPKNEPLKESNDNKRLPSIHIGLAPLESDGSCVIKERMTQALRYFKESTEQRILAQVWAPVKNRGRFVLTTSGQPYVLDPHNSGLNQYRMVSVMYMFSVDEDSDEGDQGLPGRVFQHKLPEWTPNVQYYSSREFSRLDHAHNYNVQGTLALPVFEPSGQSCVAVIELILTSQKIHYAPEVDKVCKALQAVNLKSSEILEQPKTQFFNQICNKGRHNALAEILEIITVVCETYKLPLAQTWVPCRHRSVLAYGGGVKKSCSSFDGSCMGQICMSTSDVAFYVVDAHIWGFREACAEHHLQAGQGVSGRAFSSHNACFCSDITKFSKTEYPLVHYARLFGLTSCFAICLRSTHTGNDDYVLEFFLPPSMKDANDQQTLLNTLMDTMKQHFRSLKIASKEELEDEKSIKIIKGSVDENIDSGFESIKVSQSAKSSSGPEKLLSNGGGMHHHRALEKQLAVELDVLNDRSNACSETKQKKKTSVKKRGKAEKSISLDVLQQYFAGSLKDAAKSLGVCPTTMKRICRQHGISRWPSRKINKVSRSLSKLKRVIESVSWPAGNNGSNQQISPRHNKPPEPLHENIGSPTSKTPKTPESNERTKTRSDSGEESAVSPNSHGSFQRSPPNENTSHILSHQEHLIRIDDSVTMAHQLNISTQNPFPDAQKSFGAMLIEDCGSSKDLQNLCPEFNWTTPKLPEFSPKQPIPLTADTAPNIGTRQEMTTVTIKATYREDIIRFKIPLSCGIFELREEIAKRLKLEVGTFDIKYMDDDRELVLIACDADLQECMDVSSSSGGNMIRLSISDVMASLGSSCESNG